MLLRHEREGYFGRALKKRGTKGREVLRGLVSDIQEEEFDVAAEAGNPIRSGQLVVSLQNEDHSGVVLSWKLLRARPIKVTFGPFNAKGTDVALEELVLACERMEME